MNSIIFLVACVVFSCVVAVIFLLYLLYVFVAESMKSFREEEQQQ